MKKVYICTIDETCPDYLFTKALIDESSANSVNIEDCNSAFFTAGTYLTKNNAKPMEKEIDKALNMGKEIVIIKPYGTSYTPLYFRRQGFKCIECIRPHIIKELDGVYKGNGQSLYNRYQ